MRHKNGDKNPSFAVKRNGGFVCSCGAKGHWTQLYREAGLAWPGADLDFVPAPLWKPDPVDHASLGKAWAAVRASIKFQIEGKNELRRRGLKSADIEHFERMGYRSVPQSLGLRQAVGQAVRDAVGPDIAARLPFIDAKGDFVRLARREPGLLIPLCDGFGITAAQVRWIGAKKDRYYCFPGSSRPYHVVIEPGAAVTVVVEGALSAEIVFLEWPRMFGFPVNVVGLLGADRANDREALIEALGAAGGRRVVLALDPDVSGENGTQGLLDVLESVGTDAVTAAWTVDQSDNGLDRFLASRSSRASDLKLYRPYRSRPALPAIATPTPRFASLEEARPPVRKWLKQKLRGGPGVSSLAGEMGLGKTQMAIDVINDLRKKRSGVGRVGFFVSRWEQVEQFEETRGWQFHYGVDHKSEPCKNRRLMLTVIGAGEPTATACGLCKEQNPKLWERCQAPGAKAPGEPFYLSQAASTSDIHVYTLDSLRSPAVMRDLQTIVIDDGDLEKASVDRTQDGVDKLGTDKTALSWKCLAQALKWSETHSYYADAAPVLEALLALRAFVPKPRHRYDRPRLNGSELQDRLAEHFGGLEALNAALTKAASIQDDHPWEEGRPHRAILRMVRRLHVELGSRDTNFGNPAVHVKAGGVTLWTKWQLDFTGKVVIILKASKGAEQYRRIFPGAEIDVFEASVALPKGVKVVQHVDGALTRTKADLLAARVIAGFEEWEAPGSGVRTLVTYLNAKDAISEAVPNLKTQHFGNQTGSNELKESNLHVVAGNHCPHPADFLEEAQAIWQDAETLDTTPYRVRETFPGHQHSEPRIGFRDPRLDGRWRELTVGEVRQGFGRCRPWDAGEVATQGLLWGGPGASRKSRPLEIHVISSYPIDGVVVDEFIGGAADDDRKAYEAGAAIVAAGDRVTLKSLMEATGLSDRQAKKRLPAVKASVAAGRWVLPGEPVDVSESLLK